MTKTVLDLSARIDCLRYDISKKLPCLRRGHIRIETSYGELELEGEVCRLIADLIDGVLHLKLYRLEQQLVPQTEAVKK